LEAIDIERASVLMQINTLKQEISIRKENLQGMLFSFPKKETLCAATDRKTGSLRQQISSSSREVDTSCRKYMLKSLYVGRTSRETYSDIFNIFHDSQCSMLCVDGDASGIVDVKFDGQRWGDEGSEGTQIMKFMLSEYWTHEIISSWETMMTFEPLQLRPNMSCIPSWNPLMHMSANDVDIRSQQTIDQF
jgi:hypothetical protein